MPSVKKRGQEAGFGREVRRLRLELGMTQQELAERVGDGTTQSDISGVERGAVILPKKERLAKFAQALETTPGALLAKSGWMGAEEALSGLAQPMPTGAAAARILTLLDQMDEGDRRVLASVAERFARQRRRHGVKTGEPSDVETLGS